ncbi:hypothetical protein ACO2Q3_09255 [Caulobacter sp. KR2-114]|uniref:hypothetical protein n=1 Tax=Caulobacter sp. KR2-114 TaxID=3400912 RepID=UPI003C11A34C
MQGLSVSAALRSALDVLATGWRRGWGALLPAALLLAIAHILRGEPLDWLVGVGAVLWCAQAAAVCYRIGLGLSVPALAGSRVTRDVPRLLVAGLLQLILLGIITALMLTVVGAVAFGVAAAGKGFQAAEPATWLPAMGPTGRSIAGAVALVGLAGVIWLRLRLAFSAAATVERQKVQVLSAWPTTRGRVLATLAALVLASLPTLAVAWGVRAAGLAGGAEGAFAFALAAIGVSLPLQAGLMTYLYRQSTTTT